MLVKEKEKNLLCPFTWNHRGRTPFGKFLLVESQGFTMFIAFINPMLGIHTADTDISEQNINNFFQF